MSDKKTKLRFAPSPTGPLTLGNARTALFNWLYAKHVGGEFLLRIEDTDKEKSKKKYEKDIDKGLKWLGLDWDGEVYRQSDRLDLYKKYLNQLIEDDKAYWCFCSKKELEEEKEKRKEKGLSPKYSGKCRDIGPEEARKRIEDGESAVVRFKMPKANISFKDIVRDKVDVDGSEIGDFVIATSEDRPLYNFAVVVDDHEMDITHVVRGEDHISNTPRQVAILEALGFERPEYAHLPLILSPEGGKLSKRFRESSLMKFKKQGYVPGAMFNFMALLGWHPKEDKEVISREEAVEEFTLDRVQKGGASLDMDKLDWYNGYYIRNMETKKLVECLKDFIPEEWSREEERLLGAVEAEKERIKKLTDFKDKASFFFDLPDYDGEMLVWKEKIKESKKSIESIYDFLKRSSELDLEDLESHLLDLSDEMGGKGEVYWPLRVAMSGQKASPGPLEIIKVLGLEEALKRLEKAKNKFSKIT